MERKTFPVKQVQMGQSSVPIIMQKDNGPCFVLALINAITLAISIDKFNHRLTPPSLGEIHQFIAKLHDSKYIAEKEIIDLLCGCIFDNDDSTFKAKDKLLEALPTLNSGLNLNPKLNAVVVDDYYNLTDAIKSLLSLFELNIYHGFIMNEELILQVDYEQPENNVISFDSCQDLMIKLMNEDKRSLMPKLQSFFETNNTQLTFEGIALLSESIKPNEIGIFFRNDHFSTFLKRQEDENIYLLVTDAGLTSLKQIMWQQLTINDDTDFLTNDFKNVEFNDDQLAELTSQDSFQPTDDKEQNFRNNDISLVKQLQAEEDELQAKRLQKKYDKQAKQSRTLPKGSTGTPIKKAKSNHTKDKKSKSCHIM